MIYEYHEEIKKIHRQMIVRLKSESTAGENREYEFVYDEGKYMSLQRRKQNALDY
jgi:hypothetical protein